MNIYYTFIVVIGTHLLVPTLLNIWLLLGKNKCKLDWITKAAIALGNAIILFMAGNWFYIGYYFRYLVLILCLILILITFRKIKALKFYVPKKNPGWLLFAIKSILIIYIIFQTISVSCGYVYKDQSVELMFPLKDGVYYTSDGGSNMALNSHNIYPEKRFKYAMDIEKLNAYGVFASGIMPKDLNKYNIFGEVIYAPCDGYVSDENDGSPDFIPPENEATNGNFIEINYDVVTICIGHIKNGSLLVHKGDKVSKGQPIAKVGNSGFTIMPHLHIHAYKNGEGIPIIFNGKTLERNSLYFADK